MRRIIRIARTATALVSLVLCAGVSAMWAGAYCDGVYFERGRVLLVGGRGTEFGEFRRWSERNDWPGGAALWHELRRNAAGEGHSGWADAEFHRGVYNWGTWGTWPPGSDGRS